MTDTLRRGLIIDVETAPIADAAQYLEEPTAPANYSKPDTIAAYVAKAKAEQLDKCALDLDLARIVAIGVQDEDDNAPMIRLCKTEDAEHAALSWLWSLIQPYPYPRLIGWNLLAFDVPMLQRRSFYLDVKTPPITLGRWKHPDIDDLMLIWSYDGAAKMRSKDFVCRRLGITSSPPDTLTGADIPQAVAEDRWGDVLAHVTADVQKTARLAERMGLFSHTESVL